MAHLLASLLLAALAACSVPWGAQAHGGGLHRWTFNTDVAKVIKTASVRTDVHDRIATCSDWRPLNYTAISPAIYPLPFFPATLNMSVSGSVDVVSYLSNNCTSGVNSGLFPFLKLSVSTWNKKAKKWRSGPPPAGSTAFGYGFTGTCSAPGNLYRDNVTLQDSRFNLAWWGAEGVIGEGMNLTDTYPGYLWGSAPVSWLFRADKSPMRSIVLVAQSGPSFCCNVKYDGPAPDAILSKGHSCSSPAPHK